MEPGRTKSSHGATTRSANRRMSAIQKGVTPRKIVPVHASPTTPFGSKTFSPTGGGMRLIPVTTTTTTPNQIGTIPSDVNLGKE